MIRKLLRRAGGREGDPGESIETLESLVFANENVIQCLTGARFSGQVVPGHKRFLPAEFVHCPAQRLLQTQVEWALGRAVEIAANQVGDLAILRRLNMGDQFLNLRLTDCIRTALLKVHIPDVQY